jgi:magnesium-transporting ATPase (P-type)
LHSELQHLKSVSKRIEQNCNKDILNALILILVVQLQLTNYLTYLQLLTQKGTQYPAQHTKHYSHKLSSTTTAHRISLFALFILHIFWLAKHSFVSVLHIQSLVNRGLASSPGKSVVASNSLHAYMQRC